MAQRMTRRQEKRVMEGIRDRGDPYLCLFCKGIFTDENRHTFEHLDGNLLYHKTINIALAHWKCNNDKEKLAEYQVIAALKLQENKKKVSSCAGNGGRISLKQLTSTQESSKIQRNYLTNWVFSKLLEEGKLQVRKVIPAVVNGCQMQYGCGSQSAMYRMVEELTNSYNGLFNLFEEDGVAMIRLRKEELKIDRT